MRLLVTGFTPFGGENVNPSWQAVERLPDTIGTAEVCKLELPTVFSKSVATITDAIHRLAPDAVLSVGQAGGRDCVTVEKVAINYVDAEIPDNEGNLPRGEPLIPGAPDAYFATVPVKAMVENVKAHGMPCKVSYSAGVYVCNCVMYNTLHLAAVEHPAMQVGFIHVPYSTEQLAGREMPYPSLSLEEIVRALHCAIEPVTQQRCVPLMKA